MRLRSTPPFQSLSHYVDAPKPTHKQFNEHFAIQKECTSFTMQMQDYFHLPHDQPAGFTTLCPVMALCFSECATDIEARSTKRRRQA